MHTYAPRQVYVCFTGVIAGIKHILCRVGCLCFDPTRAPVVA